MSVKIADLQAKFNTCSQEKLASVESMQTIQAANEVPVKSNDQMEARLKELGVENGKLESARQEAEQALAQIQE